MSIREMTQVHQRGPMGDPRGVGPFTRGGFLVLISIRHWLGGCWGTHLHPLFPLPGVLPGDQEADGQAGPPGPSPPAVVRSRVLWPHSTAPHDPPLPHVPWDRGQAGEQPGIPVRTPSAPFF